MDVEIVSIKMDGLKETFDETLHLRLSCRQTSDSNLYGEPKAGPFY